MQHDEKEYKYFKIATKIKKENFLYIAWTFNSSEPMKQYPTNKFIKY